MSSRCVLCIEIEQYTYVTIEDELFCAVWDVNPLRPGHTIVIPKTHKQFYSELSEQELNAMPKFIELVQNKLSDRSYIESNYTKLLTELSEDVKLKIHNSLEQLKSYKSDPTAFNHGLNDGPDAGQSIPHLHYHIIPRWKGDVEKPKGGIRRMFGEDAYSNG